MSEWCWHDTESLAPVVDGFVMAEDWADLQPLVEEYKIWLEQNCLPLESADELIFRDDLTRDQRVWLSEFIQRWEDIV